jgi:AraC-like DNA-binding protein
MEFAQYMRPAYAARLLEETDQTISEIASGSGYATISNFNRRFRDRLGMAPREYRKALGPANLT